MAVHFTFEPVEIGAGWTSVEAWSSGGPIVLIVEAWSSGGPIVLIEGRSATRGVIVKSRRDSQKQAFIDPNPF